MAEARAEADEASDSLLIAIQNLGNKQGEIDLWKDRAEAAEKTVRRKDTSERVRGLSLERSDSEDDDTYSLGGRSSRTPGC